MGRYKLSRTAINEVAEIIGYLHRETDPAVADKMEKKLFAAFNDLSTGHVVGHRRIELTDRNVLFHLARPYLIVFRKSGETIFVVHVIHGSRDLKRLLQ
jgi:plasmid stabilization system protein ParE